MTKQQIYEIWRPERSPWSRWVKPVLFSFLSGREQETVGAPMPTWDVPLEPGTAIIADLPGADGVALGVALCHAGYRPIPIYNACPFAPYDPASTAPPSILNDDPPDVPVLVDVLPIMAALSRTAEKLAAASLPPSAPPVFLLDSDRQASRIVPDTWWFDNRSFVTPADFPSGAFFKQHGLTRIVLVHNAPKIQVDLLQILLSWQRAGMAFSRQVPWKPWGPQPMTVKRPAWIIQACQQIQIAVTRRRNPSGAFGRLVSPTSS